MGLITRVLIEALGTLGKRKKMAAGAGDTRSLVAHIPTLARLAEIAAASRILLGPLYRQYVERISSPAWAVSIETAALLHALCTIRRPAAILDLGSGFSSVAFRLYAKSAGHECIIHSVDDDPVWLERSARFLGSQSLSTEGLVLLTALQDQSRCKYDLVLHDLSNMATRTASLPFILSQRAAAGWVVLDDMHMEPYGSTARELLTAAGLAVYPLRELTLDRFGRFASLACDR